MDGSEHAGDAALNALSAGVVREWRLISRIRRLAGRPDVNHGEPVGVDPSPRRIGIQQARQGLRGGQDRPSDGVASDNLVEQDAIGFGQLAILGKATIAVEFAAAVDEDRYALPDQVAAERVVVEHRPAGRTGARPQGRHRRIGPISAHQWRGEADRHRQRRDCERGRRCPREPLAASLRRYGAWQGERQGFGEKDRSDDAEQHLMPHLT